MVEHPLYIFLMLNLCLEGCVVKCQGRGKQECRRAPGRLLRFIAPRGNTTFLSPPVIIITTYRPERIPQSQNASIPPSSASYRFTKKDFYCDILSKKKKEEEGETIFENGEKMKRVRERSKCL